jgi:hypothetical protein
MIKSSESSYALISARDIEAAVKLNHIIRLAEWEVTVLLKGIKVKVVPIALRGAVGDRRVNAFRH